jgi:hypothetical protein
VPIGEEAGWASELVWTQRLEEKYFASAGNRTPVVQSVVRHYLTELPQLLIATSFLTKVPYFIVRICNAFACKPSVIKHSGEQENQIRTNSQVPTTTANVSPMCGKFYILTEV